MPGERKGEPEKDVRFEDLVFDEPKPAAPAVKIDKARAVKPEALASAKEEAERAFEFAEVCRELKRDFDEGKAGYAIQTKIHAGKSFKNYTELDATHKGGVELYNLYRESKPGSEISKYVGFWASDTLPTSWYHKGEAAIVETPLTVAEYKTVKRPQKVITFWGNVKEKMVKQEIREERPRTLKDMDILGPDENEEMVVLSLAYINSTLRYADKRQWLTTSMEFTMKKKLAGRAMEEIRKDPQNFLNLIKFFEPKLLEVTSPPEPIRKIDVFDAAQKKSSGPMREPTEVISAKK